MINGWPVKPAESLKSEEESNASNFVDQVQQGILLLKESPYSEKLGHIDLDRLDLSNKRYCVLGQMGFYSSVAQDLNLSRSDLIDFGFDVASRTKEGYAELTEEWRKQLRKERDSDTIAGQ